MLIRYWISDVCSSDRRSAPQLLRRDRARAVYPLAEKGVAPDAVPQCRHDRYVFARAGHSRRTHQHRRRAGRRDSEGPHRGRRRRAANRSRDRSEEHTSELQSLMRISYAVFCLKKKNNKNKENKNYMLTLIVELHVPYIVYLLT